SSDGNYSIGDSSSKRLNLHGRGSIQKARLHLQQNLIHATPQADSDDMKLLMNAAIEGDPNAQYNVGDIYQNAKGIPQDLFKAATWYLRAAIHGLAIAQYKLGQMYSHGQ
ncbi:hypothetical protein BGX27_006328, partial [Mortierella sp. AM989]